MKSSVSYIIRYSARATFVRLRVSIRHGVEVIVPQGYDTIRIPALIAEKEEWITKTLVSLHTKHQAKMHHQQYGHQEPPSSPEEFIPAPVQTGILPTSIYLQALEETWRVEYHAEAIHHIRLTPHITEKILHVSGAIRKKKMCVQALRLWLKRYALEWMTRITREISVEIELPCKAISVRLQKTRWGSCSSEQNISLNAVLLFVPHHLMRYVIIHELCHTKHMNHSAAYWGLVAEKEPNYEEYDSELKSASRWIPWWGG
jgi:predicted metal-dependent hydrolase